MSNKEIPGKKRATPRFAMRELCSGESLSNLIHKLCHEIDNPLTAIISIAAVIQRSDPRTDSNFAEKLPTYAEAMSREAWRVSGLAEKLLLMSSTRSESPAPCDANKILRSTVAKLLDADEFGEVDVSLKLPEEATIIELDQEQLVSLYRELLLNSFAEVVQLNKSAAAANPTTVQVVLTRTDEILHITFSNAVATSRGAQLESLFEPFVTYPPQTHALGLGLTVAWGIVERAGGTISIEERNTESGLEFSTIVSLPRAARSADVKPENTLVTGNSHPPEPRTSLISILIIEDEAMVASAMSKILELSFERSGGASCTVLGGREALAELRSGASYDVILCDLNLKGASGRHIYELICTERPELKRSFAFLTGDSLSSETSLYLKGSGRPYLFKPFEPEQIISLVRDLASAEANDTTK